MRRMPLLSAALLVGTIAAVCALFQISAAETAMAPTPIARAPFGDVRTLAADILPKHDGLSWLHWEGSKTTGLVPCHWSDTSGHTTISDWHYKDTLTLGAMHMADTQWVEPPAPRTSP